MLVFPPHFFRVLILTGAFCLGGCRSDPAFPANSTAQPWHPPRSAMFAGDSQMLALSAIGEGSHVGWRDQRVHALGNSPALREQQEEVRFWRYEGQRVSSHGRVIDHGYQVRWFRGSASAHGSR